MQTFACVLQWEHMLLLATLNIIQRNNAHAINTTAHTLWKCLCPPPRAKQSTELLFPSMKRPVKQHHSNATSPFANHIQRTPCEEILWLLVRLILSNFHLLRAGDVNIALRFLSCALLRREKSLFYGQNSQPDSSSYHYIARVKLYLELHKAITFQLVLFTISSFLSYLQILVNKKRLQKTTLKTRNILKWESAENNCSSKETSDRVSYFFLL